MEHLVDQNGDQCPLYELLLDAKILPFYDNQNNFSPKVVSVDPMNGTIRYGDQDVDPYSQEDYSRYYCTTGSGDNQVACPTGITYGTSFEANNYEVYPIYVADHNNSRIIKSNFMVAKNDEVYPYFDETSFEVISRNVYLPYDIDFFDVNSNQNDKIWVSEDYGNGALVCLNSDGSINTKIKGFRYTYNFSEYFTVLFEPGAKISLAIYKPMNCFGFIYSIPQLDINEICTFLLNSDGEPLHMYNDSIVEVWREHFNSDYPLTSINFQNINLYSTYYPYMWITSGGFNPPSVYSNMVHGFAINDTANFAYLGSTGLPRNSHWYFTNLLNTVTGIGYYDIFTIEEWSDVFGLRQYYPFADIHSDFVTNYCDDSTDFLYWKGAFTNDCFARVWAERKNEQGYWEAVEIKYIDGFSQPPGTYDPVIFRLKGYRALTNEDPIEIKLNLPLKDYVFGNSVIIKVKLFPDYIYPDNSENYVYTDYEVEVKKTCLRKPGGCPFIYVKDINNETVLDNNILHKSEFVNAGSDIHDMYKLNILPSVDNNEVTISVVENEGDQSSFNQFRLYAVDHPTGKKLAITENNQIVLFDESSVVNADFATLNGTGIITSRIIYPGADTLAVKGFINDSIYADYNNALRIFKNNQRKSNADQNQAEIIKKDKKQNNNDGVPSEKNNIVRNDRKLYNNSDLNLFTTVESLAVIMDLSNLDTLRPVVSKYWAGNMFVNFEAGGYLSDLFFARREKSSIVAFPVLLNNGNDNVDNLYINWLSDYEVQYISLASLIYNDEEIVISDPLPFNSASLITRTSTTDVRNELTDEDGNSVSMDSSALITLKFSVEGLGGVPLGYEREYVLETVGYYITQTDRNIAHAPNTQIPLTNKLYNNYPNPFNPLTTIKYDLAKNSMVKITIYNILGQEIKVLVNELKKAGSYNIKFDATNYASGIYFYRIEAGDFIEAKKMVLVK